LRLSDSPDLTFFWNRRDDEVAVSVNDTEAPATTTLASRTQDLADQIATRLCPGEFQAFLARD